MSLAFSPAGHAALGWWEEDVVCCGSSIYVAIREQGGSGWTLEEIGLDAGTFNESYPPVLGIDELGNVFAAWGVYGDSATDIYVARRPSGGGWGASVRVDTSPHHAGPAHISASAGHAELVWRQPDLREGGSGTDDHVYARHYDPAEGWSEPTMLMSSLDSDGYTFTYPKVALGPTGEALAVWREVERDHLTYDLWMNPKSGGWAGARLVDVRADEVSGEPLILPVVRPDGSSFVLWSAAAQLLTAFGGAEGDVISPAGTGSVSDADAAVNAEGHVLVGWSHVVQQDPGAFREGVGLLAIH